MSAPSYSPDDLTRHAAALRRVALAVVKDSAAAEDVLQNAYLTALDRPQGPMDLRWWTQVVRSRAFDFLRRERTRREHERIGAQLEDDVVCEPVIERLETFTVLVTAISTLPEDLQEVLYLRYFDGLTPTEIASRKGSPVKTIKTRLSRALELMRERLGKHFGESEGGWHGMLLGPLGLALPKASALAVEGAKGVPLGSFLVGASVVLAVILVGTFAVKDSSFLERKSPSALPIGARAVTSSKPAANSIPDSNPHSPTPHAGNSRQPLDSGAAGAIGANVDPEATQEEQVNSGNRSTWLRVIDMRSGQPISGAKIVPVLSGEPLDSSENSAGGRTLESAPDGLVELLRGPGEPHVWQVRAQGYGPTTFAGLGPGHNDPAHPILLGLTLVAQLQIHLIDGARTPLANFDVLLDIPTFQLPGERDLYMRSSLHKSERRTDSNGEVVFEGLPAGEAIRLRVFHDRQVLPETTKVLRLIPGETRQLSWVIQEAVHVQGLLVDQDGQPFVGQTVWLTKGGKNMVRGRERFYFRAGDVAYQGQRAVTDSRGRFHFPEVAPGTWYIGPGVAKHWPSVADPHSPAPVATRVQVPAAGPLEELRLQVHRGTFISGTVTTSDGAEPDSNRVVGESELGSMWNSGFDGGFRLGPLEPGIHRVWHNRGAADGAVVEVEAPSDGLALSIGPSGKLSATWVHPITKAPCKAMAVLSLKGSRAPVSSLYGQVAGYKLTRTELNPGTYNLSVSTEDGFVGYSSNLEVRAGFFLENTPVALAAGAWIELRYDSSTELASYLIFHEGVLVSCGPIQAGTSQLCVAPAGAIQVEFHQGREVLFERQLRLNAGEQGRVVFEQD